MRVNSASMLTSHNTISAAICRRYYITRHSLHSLNDVGLLRFRGEPMLASFILKLHHACYNVLHCSMLALRTTSAKSRERRESPLTGLLLADDVYTQVKQRAKDAMLVAIEQEREGEQIDRSLLKNVLGIFIEVGMGTMDAYNLDFEQHLLSTTSEYYKKKAASWIAVSTPAAHAR